MMKRAVLDVKKANELHLPLGMRLANRRSSQRSDKISDGRNRKKNPKTNAVAHGSSLFCSLVCHTQMISGERHKSKERCKMLDETISRCVPTNVNDVSLPRGMVSAGALRF